MLRKFFLGLVVAVLILGIGQQPAFGQEVSRVDGVWNGSYECSAGPTDLRLELFSNAVDPRRISAVFNFGGGFRPTGAYTLTGSYNPRTGALNLTPEAWINRPSGFRMVGMSGRIDVASGVFSGTITDVRCKQFAVRLAGKDTVAKPRPSAPINISGDWSGQYWSPSLDPVAFTMTLQVNGGQLLGRSSERVAAGIATAQITGQITGNEVRITKTYDGSAGLRHSVSYQGFIEAEVGSISGTWTLSGATGQFQMRRAERSAPELPRAQPPAPVAAAAPPRPAPPPLQPVTIAVSSASIEAWNKALNELVALDSRTWLLNRYDYGSMVNARVIATSASRDVLVIRGEYTYNGGARGWVSVRVDGDGPKCLEFWDFAGSCRPLRSNVPDSVARVLNATAVNAALGQSVKSDVSPSAARSPRDAAGQAVSAEREIDPVIFLNVVLKSCAAPSLLAGKFLPPPSDLQYAKTADPGFLNSYSISPPIGAKFKLLQDQESCMAAGAGGDKARKQLIELLSQSMFVNVTDLGTAPDVLGHQPGFETFFARNGDNSASIHLPPIEDGVLVVQVLRGR
jgi:hypothetical protein